MRLPHFDFTLNCDLAILFIYDVNFHMYLHHRFPLALPLQVLYQDDKVEVHWLQSFPYTNEDFFHHAERGLLAGRVDLKLFSKGFESIHLKCTNNDVKGLKVVPLPISEFFFSICCSILSRRRRCKVLV